jgi:hypothetical protein
VAKKKSAAEQPRRTGPAAKRLAAKRHRPEKTAPGRKTEKQRITFLACTNSIGNHKVKPLVIGKAKTPRAFKNLPVLWIMTIQNQCR